MCSSMLTVINPPHTHTHTNANCLPLPLCCCCYIFLSNTCISHLRPLLCSDTWLNCSSKYVWTGATLLRLIGSHVIAFWRPVFRGEQSVWNNATNADQWNCAWSRVYLMGFSISSLRWYMKKLLLAACWFLMCHLSR